MTGLERPRLGDSEGTRSQGCPALQTALLRMPQLLKACLGPEGRQELRGAALARSLPAQCHSVWSH